MSCSGVPPCGCCAGRRARSELWAEGLEDGEQSGCAFISAALPLISTDHIWCQHGKEESRGPGRARCCTWFGKPDTHSLQRKTIPQTRVWKDLVCLAFSGSSSTAGQKFKQKKKRPALLLFLADTQEHAFCLNTVGTQLAVGCSCERLRAKLGWKSEFHQALTGLIALDHLSQQRWPFLTLPRTTGLCNALPSVERFSFSSSEC